MYARMWALVDGCMKWALGGETRIREGGGGGRGPSLFLVGTHIKRSRAAVGNAAIVAPVSSHRVAPPLTRRENDTRMHTYS